MRRVAALVAIALLLLTGPLVGAAAADPAQPSTTAAAPLTLDLQQLSPRVVTAAGAQLVTVTGTITNTGTTPVRAIGVRLQRGEALRSDADARAALDGRDATDAVTPEFTDLPGELAPGASAPLHLEVPVGAGGTGLGITRPGVYPLLVNVNGEPDDAPRARLAAVRMLLPVLSLPAGPEAPAAADPAPFTLVYPITDVPRRLPTVPGETPTLGDDDLATSFGPGGRLNGLLAALAQRAPSGSAMRSGVCVAVDPDLLQTAAAMRQGYQVRGPDGSTHPGTGADTAGRWLDTLVSTLRGGCVITLPFADADLVAMTRGGLGADAAQAVTDGAEIVADLLGTAPTRSVLWPADGVIDDATLAALAEPTRTSGLLLSAEGVDGTGTGPDAVRVGRGTGGPRALLADPLLTAAATAATGLPRSTPGAAVTSVAVPPSTPLSTQDTVGVLAYRAATADGTPIVLAPPHQWPADGAGADALLSSVSLLLEQNQLVARPLTAALEAGPAPAESLFYPARAGAAEISQGVVDRSRALGDDIAAMAGAAIDDPGADLTPDEVFEPLRRATLRPVSAAWRGRPAAADAAADIAADRIRELRSTVRVLEPPGPYSLGTSDAPLLLTVANGLPVPLDVRVEIVSTAGLRVAPIPEQRVPPLGRIQVRANAQVVRAGQFAVDAVVRTPEGTILGPPTRLQVRSTAYGTVTVWITAIAGVLLVLLVTRRLLRRFRGDRPEPPSATVPGGGPPDDLDVPRAAAPDAPAADDLAAGRRAGR